MAHNPRPAGAYFDGFNIYHTVCDYGKNYLKWMCYRSLAEQLAASASDRLVLTKVFTAYAEWLKQSASRHKVVASAWRARGAEVVLGRFKANQSECKSCGSTWRSHEEKESDVNIGAHLLADCLTGRIEVAYLVSGDTDMVGALKLLREECPNVELVYVSIDGRRSSGELRKYSNRQITITEQDIDQCRLPDAIEVNGTVVARCPTEYLKPKK